jgi:hypothetical protein
MSRAPSPRRRRAATRANLEESDRGSCESWQGGFDPIERHWMQGRAADQHILNSIRRYVVAGDSTVCSNFLSADDA